MSAACLVKERVEMHVLQGSSALTRAGTLLELGLTRVLQGPAAIQHVTIKGLKQVQTQLLMATPVPLIIWMSDTLSQGFPSNATCISLYTDHMWFATVTQCLLPRRLVQISPEWHLVLLIRFSHVLGMTLCTDRTAIQSTSVAVRATPGSAPAHTRSPSQGVQITAGSGEPPRGD